MTSQSEIQLTHPSGALYMAEPKGQEEWILSWPEGSRRFFGNRREATSELKREVSARPAAWDSECEHDLTTYRGMIGAYRRLLQANPGKALVIEHESFAILLGENYVANCGAYHDGAPYIDHSCDLLESWWESRGCWCWDETPEQSASRVLQPVFVDID
ncbi:hypothetical protein [Pseudomonas sp.]|uniref:hypothetical protein n=1 Tax=Pseudomonas sp. TaxID=306 RepID=UPI00289A9F3E|nr:hypothetical protein [Pseudomonas sp.]